jgi:hypothetical protein
MLPTVAAAIGLEVDAGAVQTRARRIDHAAVSAAAHTGTEMSAVGDGATAGRNRWAVLRRRRRSPIPSADDIDAELTSDLTPEAEPTSDGPAGDPVG